MAKRHFLTLIDGTELKVGDPVKSTDPKGRSCTMVVDEILQGTGVDKAVLRAKDGSTVIRSRYQIKAL